MYVEEVPKRFPASEPTSFEELLDPEFEDKMRQHTKAAASQLLERVMDLDR